MYEHTSRRPHGGVMLLGDSAVEHDTQQCPHCGGHFIIKPGSGTRRAFCTRCAAVTCGNHACDVCIPFEAKLEHMEGKKTPYTPAITEQEEAELARQLRSMVL